jgi:hypothetical protein
MTRVDFLLASRSRTKSCPRGPTRVPPRAARGDVDDVAGAALAYARQHSLNHSYSSENVHVELMAHVVERRFFHQSFVAVTGVVDQHIDRADLRLDLGDGARDRDSLCNIQYFSESAPRAEGVKIGAGLLGPDGSRHILACRHGFPGEGKADAGTNACGEESLCCHGSCVFSSRINLICAQDCDLT